jgi:hypothetical protein
LIEKNNFPGGREKVVQLFFWPSCMCLRREIPEEEYCSSVRRLVCVFFGHALCVQLSFGRRRTRLPQRVSATEVDRATARQRNSRSPREGATLNECFLRRTARATTLQNFFHRSSPNKDELSFCEILARAKTKTHTRTRQTVPSVTQLLRKYARQQSTAQPITLPFTLPLSLSLSPSPSLVCRSRSSPSLCPVTSPSLPLQYPLVVVFETHPSQQRESTNHVLRPLLLHVGRRFTFASRWQSACSQWSSQDQN